MDSQQPHAIRCFQQSAAVAPDVHCWFSMTRGLKHIGPTPLST
jgi:hypothetical protein